MPHKKPRAFALPKFLRASTAVSTPPRAAELQATRRTRAAATQLPPTHWAWLAAPTTLASQPWQATLPSTAPHAAQEATGFCATEVLKSFDCSLYASTCSGTTGYKAYSGCSDTVAANPMGMACRIYHLGVAAMAGNATEHCPHAAPDATGPCATEVLKSFNCSLYASTRSGTTGYTAYSGCLDTVAANPLGMEHRRRYPHSDKCPCAKRDQDYRVDDGSAINA
ncbi:unnamed protein product [Polarella glacialis]|uniref:Uncharacterized protein n=3 Tax=Polarella glacialis TaxID=89957 RepID=A0A813H6D2_POLGL|nr:unnamed protein product [Polarella glacialis]